MRRADYERAIAHRPMRPLRVTVHLAAPLCSADGYVHLDAIVAFAAMHACHYPGHHRPRAAVSSDSISPCPPLPFAAERGVSACSVLWPTCSDRAITRWHMRPALEYATLAKPAQIRVDNGSARMRREPITLWPAQILIAYAVGEPRLIATMLRQIPSVGHKRSQGYGRVARWAIDEDEAAINRWHTRDDDTTARPLPHPAGVMTGVRPPYWYRPWWQAAIPAGELVPS